MVALARSRYPAYGFCARSYRRTGRNSSHRGGALRASNNLPAFCRLVADGPSRQYFPAIGFGQADCSLAVALDAECRCHGRKSSNAGLTMFLFVGMKRRAGSPGRGISRSRRSTRESCFGFDVVVHRAEQPSRKGAGGAVKVGLAIKTVPTSRFPFRRGRAATCPFSRPTARAGRNSHRRVSRSSAASIGCRR